MKKYIAELIGTAVLVLIGCGSAAIAEPVIGNIGISLSFGFAIIGMAYAIGPISGCHINPAVTMGMLVAGKIEKREAGFYMLFQTIGAILGALLLALIVNPTSGLGVNMLQYDVTQTSAIAFELIFTFIFVFVILMTTSKVENQAVSGLVIGFTLAAIHLVGIPVTGTSVNPARSIGPALVTMHPDALTDLWIFMLIPMIGAIIAGCLYRYFNSER